MPIEFSCQNCHKTLRVPSEFVGRKARCPNCQTVNVIIDPQAGSEFSASEIPSTQTTPPSFQDTNPGPDYRESDYASSSQTTNTFKTQPQGTGNPYSSPTRPPQHYSRPAYSQTPHRGGLILTLGILSVFCNFCLVPGILSLSMGWIDLRKMQRGEIDREGHGLTLAGTILGGMMTAFAMLIFSIYIFIIAIAALA